MITKTGVELNTAALVQWLINSMAWKTKGDNVADGCDPITFHGSRGFIIGSNGQTFEIEISVVKNSEDFNVAGLDWSAIRPTAGPHKEHAMFRQCTRISNTNVKEHVLRNSWGTFEDFVVLEHGSTSFLETWLCSIRNLVWKVWKQRNRDDVVVCENFAWKKIPKELERLGKKHISEWLKSAPIEFIKDRGTLNMPHEDAYVPVMLRKFELPVAKAIVNALWRNYGIRADEQDVVKELVRGLEPDWSVGIGAPVIFPYCDIHVMEETPTKKKIWQVNLKLEKLKRYDIILCYDQVRSGQEYIIQVNETKTKQSSHSNITVHEFSSYWVYAYRWGRSGQFHTALPFVEIGKSSEHQYPQFVEFENEHGYSYYRSYRDARGDHLRTSFRTHDIYKVSVKPSLEVGNLEQRIIYELSNTYELNAFHYQRDNNQWRLASEEEAKILERAEEHLTYSSEDEWKVG